MIDGPVKDALLRLMAVASAVEDNASDVARRTDIELKLESIVPLINLLESDVRAACDNVRAALTPTVRFRAVYPPGATRDYDAEHQLTKLCGGGVVTEVRHEAGLSVSVFVIPLDWPTHCPPEIER